MKDQDHKYTVYLLDLWKQNWLLITAWIVSLLVLYGLCWLFQQSADPIWVFAILSGFALAIYLGFYLRRLHTIKHLLLSDTLDPQEYPQDQRRTVARLAELQQALQTQISRTKKEQSELNDYFSLWAHQVKLPLAAMDLQLQLPNPDLQEITACEKRIQTCVDQAMAYIRMDGSDYRIQRVNPETVIRPILRDNSSSFIARRISLDCSFDGKPVCTDRKWLAFVVEQLLSNALKYSPDGSKITLRVEHNTLQILDEGCGIAPEDLPRIYEKGFTGRNGHRNTLVSSGLGLYLCKKICDRLGCSLQISNRSNSRTGSDPARAEPNPEPQSGTEATVRFPDTVILGD